MEKQFQVVMKGRIHPAFDPKAFARGMAYRASRWCEEVEVKDGKISVVLKSEKEE